MTRRKPIVRIGHRPSGWVMTGSEPEACTSSYQRARDGQPPCTGVAAWKVVHDYGMRLDIGFYCDGDLPEQHRPAEVAV